VFDLREAEDMTARRTEDSVREPVSDEFARLYEIALAATRYVEFKGRAGDAHRYEHLKSAVLYWLEHRS
jgi:hypothetical protein